jgi:hypothetical protein
MKFYLKDTIDKPIRCFEIAMPTGVTKITQARHNVREILAKSAPQSPAQIDLEATQKRLLLVVDGQVGIEELKIKEIREAAWLVFQYLDDRQLRLSETEPFFSSYLNRVSLQKTPRTMTSLILSFLENYPVSSPRFPNQCLALLQALVRANQSERLGKIVGAIKKYKLLSPNGPSKITEELLLSDSTWQATLETAFLTDIRANVGIVEKVFEQCSVWVKANLERNQVDKRALTRYLEFATNDEGSNLRFVEQRTQFASTLLLPFEINNPPRDIQELLQKFFLQQFGDPRTEPARWVGVPDNVRAVLRRWLVAETFEDFFRIVNLSQQLDPDADRQWKYRRAFWRAYFNKGVISDAWLVLGPDIQRVAASYLQIDPGMHATLKRGGGVRASHSVLILKIGNYMMTEWSHMGMWRMWNETSKSCPVLYRKNYRRDDLVTNPVAQTIHSSPRSASWQTKVAKTIRERTGINVSRREFMAGV